MKHPTLVHTVLVFGLYALLFIPLLVSGSLFFPFITGKNFVFRIIVEVVTALWLLLAVSSPEYRPRRGLLLGVFFTLVASVFLSTIFSLDPFHSFWSNFERMEGAITYLHLLLYGVVLVSVFHTTREWRRFWQVNLFATLMVCAVAFAQLLGWYEVHQGTTRLDATFGNSAYLAVYLLFGIFYTLILWSQSSVGYMRRYGYPLIALVQVFVLYQTATRSALLGLLFGLGVSALLMVWRGKEYPQLRKASKILLATLLAGAALFVIARDTEFVRSRETLARFADISLSERTTESRLVLWRMSLDAVTEHPVFGWGPEMYLHVFNSYYEPVLWRQEPWFDRAHNILFDWLVTTGLLGFFSYLGLYAASIWSIWSRGSHFGLPQRALLTGLLGAYFVHNFFVFDNIMSLVLFVATLSYIHIRSTPERTLGAQLPKITLGKLSYSAVALGLVVILFFLNVRPINASRSLIQAMSPQKEGVTKNLELFEDLLSHRSVASPEATLQLALLSSSVLANESVSGDIRQKAFTLTQSMFQKQLGYTPDDARLYLVYAAFLSQAGQFDEALLLLERAQEISPRKQLLMFERASIYLQQEKYNEALALLKETLELSPEYPEAQKMYGLAALVAGRETLAKEILTPSYGGVEVPDLRFAQFFLNAGDTDRAIRVLEALDTNPGEPLSYDQHILLASLYYGEGERDASVSVLERISDSDPSQKETMEAAIAEIRKGGNPFKQ